MHNEEKPNVPAEKPEIFWNQVYIAVIITTIVVITALWIFSRQFS